MLKTTTRYVAMNEEGLFAHGSGWNKNFNKAKFYIRQADADRKAFGYRNDKKGKVFPVTITLDIVEKK